MTKKTAKHTKEKTEDVGTQEAVKEQSDALAAKVKQLESRLHESKQESDKLQEALVRKAAEFENFRKQKEREVEMSGLRTLENIIREQLPILDDVNRIVEHAPELLEKTEEAKPYIEGVELLRKNFVRWLEEKGVQKMEVLGKKMDVNFHEAITQVDVPDAEPETVVEEFQAGYVLGERVLRHAKVVVAK